MVDPTKKNTQCPRAKEKPWQDGRRGKITFRIKPHTRQRLSEGSNKTLCAPGPRDPTETEPALPLSVWVSPVESQSAVACRGDGASHCSRPGSHGRQCKSSWRRSPLAPPWSHWGDDPKTGEQLYQRSFCTVTKVLGPTTEFPNWGSSKGTEKPQGIWLWRPVGFDYRTSTGLGRQSLGGHKQSLVLTRTQEKGVVTPPKRLSQTRLWVSRSLWCRRGLTMTCCRVRGTVLA